MNKKSKWQMIKSAWKIIVGLSSFLGIIGFALQVSGFIDLWNLLILPINAFLITEIPIYYIVLLAIACTLLYFGIKFLIRPIPKLIRRRTPILDFPDARRIALLCRTPRTTKFLRQQYDAWESQSSWVVIGGYGFDDYMKRLEDEGFLDYVHGEWLVTPKALEYVTKYHGR